MFAFLSWFQDFSIILVKLGAWKGVMAWVLGIILYKLIGTKLDD